MNRRSFFGYVSGLFAGIYGAFVPRADIPPAGWQAHIIILRRSGVEFICKALCNCTEQRVTDVGDKIVVACPHKPPYYVYADGHIEFITYITTTPFESVKEVDFGSWISESSREAQKL